MPLWAFSIELERELDGRWLAAIPEMPGVMSYGATAEGATAAAHVLLLRVVADKLEHGELGDTSRDHLAILVRRAP